MVSLGLEVLSMSPGRRILPALVASVALVATGAACSAENGTDSTAGAAGSSVADERPEDGAYCDAARRTDARIGAQLSGFDPASVTRDELEQLFQVAVAETARARDAAPPELADELRLLTKRWQRQQQTFADVGYEFADAPPRVMDLAGEELEAFETVAKFNTERCSLDHLEDGKDQSPKEREPGRRPHEHGEKHEHGGKHDHVH